jgi:uncharacterized protein DUF2341/concanavalin A-like lectin/glucanase superfamily protein/purple acid phosphatase-like protein
VVEQKQTVLKFAKWVTRGLKNLAVIAARLTKWTCIQLSSYSRKLARPIHERTTKKVHNRLLQRVNFYRRWWEWEYHRHIHIAGGVIAFVTVVIIISTQLHSALALSTWTQSDWSSGVGSSTSNQYSSDSNAVTSTANQVTLSQGSSPAWYNAAWKYRQQLALNNTTSNLGVTSETLTSFPVLVKLTSSNFNFSNAQSQGQDIRFTDSNGTSILNYEIEYWNSGSQQADIWVDVPSITTNSTYSIYMYYGNSSASDAQNKNGVWNSQYLSVNHLGETTGTALNDSTSNGNTLTKPSSSLPAPLSSGEIGGAQSFNGTSSSYALSNSFGAQPTSWTAEVWFNASTSNGVVLDWDGQSGVNGGYHDSAIELVSGSLYMRAWSLSCKSIGTISTGTWYDVALTYNGSTLTGYINGVQAGTTTGSLSPPGTLYAALGPPDSTNCGSGAAFSGAIDEFRYSNVARDAAWLAASYKSEANQFVTYGSQSGPYQTSGTLVSNIFDTGEEENWSNLTYSATVPANTTVSVLVRAGNQSNLSDAPAFTSCSAISSGSAITSSCAPNKSRYVQYELEFTSDTTATPTFTSITVPYSASDITPPPTNASNIQLYRSNGGASISSDSWTNGSPYFTWTAGADDAGGSGILGYCLYLGQDPTGNPITTKGYLGTSPINTGSACQFAVSSTNLDTSLSGYIGTALASSNSPYYLNIKAIDNADNVYNGSSAQFEFLYDNTPPANPSFISAPSEFVSSKDVTLDWPTTGSDAASDANSGVAGLQYRIGSSGTWYGANHSGTQDCTDLLPNNGAYTTVSIPDYLDLNEGDNIVYFRTYDNACNVSAAYVTTVVKINTTAPSSPQNLTATPTTNTANSFAFSWLAPATYTGSASNITYCYTINTLPNDGNCTYTAAGQTSLDAGAYATEPGDNTFYVVAKDEAGNINYATAASTTFTANTPAPGVPLNADIADISVKATSNWKLALSWEAPSNAGAGVSTYKVFRSTDGVNFTDIASTAGTSYVDSGLSQQTYYYKVQACDSANNCGGFTSIVSLLPTGKFTSPANLISGPNVTVTTRTATITWTTDRDSDSSVEYGLSSGQYFSTEAANTDQVTSHTVGLNSLNAGTTYYYRAQWTDTDGNIGTSAEGTFTTLPAPSISNVTAGNINLTSATIQFTSSNATAVQLEYGGGALANTQTLNTSTNTSTYSIPLSGLSSGIIYTFRLNPYDSSGNVYDNPTAFTFTTPPQPVISNVEFQPVTGALTGTEQVSWTTNVPATSQISYGLQNGPRQNQLDTTLVTNHSMEVSGLSYATQYSLTATSVDALGNVANSDLQVFKSGVDTRPPIISDVTIQPSIVGTGADAKGQLIVSWKTDKSGTSQVAYGQGTAGDYTTTTAENTTLVNNHVVVVSGLSTSEVYHVQVISNDADGIKGVSSDQTTIIGQASDNALSIVFNALQSIFGL